MKIRLGYVALPMSIPSLTASHTITYKNYMGLLKEDRMPTLKRILEKNLKSLEKILYYNYQNEIFFYRMTSHLVPLSTHPEVKYFPYQILQNRWTQIGKLVNQYHMRIDTHVDHFCVLNSVDEDVIRSSINILQDQYFMFQAMGIDGKVVLHVGSGKYSRKAGINRFIRIFRTLPIHLQKMILLENDDRLYNALDVLMICETLGIPMVLDYHHHLCNPTDTPIEELLERIFHTWKSTKLPVKMHYSTPKNKKEMRAHGDNIDLDSFVSFLRLLKPMNQDVDIMLEAKNKDEALFRLIRGLKYKNISVSGTTIIL